MSLLSMIKIFQGFVISLIKFLQDFVISPTHFSYHNLTNFRKENLEITKICSDPGDKPCQESAGPVQEDSKDAIAL